MTKPSTVSSKITSKSIPTTHQVTHNLIKKRERIREDALSLFYKIVGD